MYECTRRVSFCHKSLLCGHTILMNCTAAAELKPQNARARSFVRSGQAPYRRQVARFAINLLPDLCPCSTLASKFIAATAALAMVAATLDESSAPNSDSRSRSPFWALVLSAGETGPLADILFQRVGCLQGKQPAAPTAGCVCVSCARACPQLNVALSDCPCVCV